jgi:hypothetical protein
VAVSQNLVHGILLRDDPQVRAFVARLKDEAPFGRIGYSILLYRLP